MLFPVYPSLSLIGTDVNAHASDYDDSTIIIAYNDTVDGYINDSWMVSLDFESKTQKSPSDVNAPIDEKVDTITQWDVIKPKANITLYQIKKGDSLAKLSDTYDISIEAIEWANDISRNDTLKPGMVLKIPPISWVIHKVSKWDTLSDIAQRYNVDIDDILRVNNIPNAAALKIGKELIIPGAVKKSSSKTQNQPKLVPIPGKTPSTTPNIWVDPTKDRYAIKYTGLSRWFAPGNCTWYVAQNKTVNWRWNAKQWLKNARAAGAKTGLKPAIGAIVQFSGRGYNRYYGHVGIVVDYTDDDIIVKDMNYRALYEVTIRKVPRNDETIDGYIYVN